MAVEGQAGNSELNKNDGADLTEQKDEEMKNGVAPAENQDMEDRSEVLIMEDEEEEQEEEEEDTTRRVMF